MFDPPHTPLDTPSRGEGIKNGGEALGLSPPCGCFPALRSVDSFGQGFEEAWGAGWGRGGKLPHQRAVNFWVSEEVDKKTPERDQAAVEPGTSQHQTAGPGAGPEQGMQTTVGPETVDIFRQFNTRGTDLGAGAALGAQVGEVSGASQIGGQQDADGAGIDPAVEMPAT